MQWHCITTSPPARFYTSMTGQYVKKSKMGAAILGNHVTNEYKILLYGRKQKQITTARFHRGFVLKVCIARLNTESSPDSLVIQDLVHGEGQAVDVGDTVEVAFSGWLLQNHSLGQIFDSNLGKEKLRAAKRGCLVCRKEVDVSLLSLLSWVLHQTVSLTMCHPPALWSLMWRSIGTYCEKFSKDRHTGELGDTFSTSPGPSPDTLTEESTTQLVTTDTNESGDQAPKWKVESIRECLKSVTLQLLSEPWELESDIDEEELYLSTEEVF
ncbi:FK506-binding protein 15 isoform X3 [Myxocyprinus asiaticus]|uniref:FK506-binding protein 15 isoform X3 n=2 Tax=Myxocyprinus asiaticus TaxID=70543 RepID=UPI0022233A84|nr:FK506-binding protein 15 isoform X3 [Myxocyprinus asiaticus]